MINRLFDFQARTRRFFDSRAKLSDLHQFGLKNTYVFSSKQGALFLVLLLITFVAGVNYGNNLILALFFYLVSVWLVSSFVAFMQITSLSIRLSHIELCQAEDIAWVNLEISSKSRSTKQIVLSFDDASVNLLDTPKQTQFLHHQTILLPKVQNTPIVIKLPVVLPKRGANILPRLKLTCQYPLGVVVAWSYARFESVAWAYPKPLAFDKHANDMTITNQESDSYANTQVGLSDFDRLDSYVQGESFARVSWGHVARGMGLLTKHFSDTVGQDKVLDYHQMPAATHEDKLSMLSYGIQSLEDVDSTYMVILPSGAGVFGTGKAFAQDNLLRLAKEP